MKVKNKDESVKLLIEKLNKKGKEKHPFLKAIAKGLNRPRRERYEVNLIRLERYADPKDMVIVPGHVLGSGEIKKALTIAALKFSKSAREKIEKAGGRCMDIEELIEKVPSGKRIKIMG